MNFFRVITIGLLFINVLAQATPMTVETVKDKNFQNGFLYQRSSVCANPDEPSCSKFQKIFNSVSTTDSPAWVVATWGSQGSLTDSWGMYDPPANNCYDSTTGGCTLVSKVKDSFVSDPDHPNYFLPAADFPDANTETNGSGNPVRSDGKLPVTVTSNVPAADSVSAIATTGSNVQPLSYMSITVPSGGGSISLKANFFNEYYFSGTNPSPGVTDGGIYPTSSYERLYPWQDQTTTGDSNWPAFYILQNSDIPIAHLKNLNFHAKTQITQYRYVPCDVTQRDAGCYQATSFTTFGVDLMDTTSGKTILVKIPIFDERTTMDSTGCSYKKRSNQSYQGAVYELSQVSGTSSPNVPPATVMTPNATYQWSCSNLLDWLYYQIPPYKLAASDDTDSTSLRSHLSGAPDLTTIGDAYSPLLLNTNSAIWINDLSTDVTEVTGSGITDFNVTHYVPVFSVYKPDELVVTVDGVYQIYGVDFTVNNATNVSFSGAGNGVFTPYSAGSASETFTMTATSSTTFSVVGSVSGSIGTATVGTDFTNSAVSFVINAGGTAFVSGDVFTMDAYDNSVCNNNPDNPNDPVTDPSTSWFQCIRFNSGHVPASGAEVVIAYERQSVTDPNFYLTLVNGLYYDPANNLVDPALGTFSGSNIYSKFALNQDPSLGKDVSTGNSTPMTSDQIVFDGDILPYVREAVVAAYDSDPTNFTLDLANYRITAIGISSWESGTSLSSFTHNISDVSLGAVIDSDNDDDGDTVSNGSDAFPLNSAASVDTDGDGHPDSWNTSCDLDCQKNSGLTLDAYPDDVNKWQVPVQNDYDGDRTSDVLMRDNVSGDTYHGQWEQFRIVDGVVNSSNMFSGSWDVDTITSLDVNGDGVSDVLVRDPSTGDWYIYIVQNGEQNGVTLLSALPTSSNWTFAAAGDFNGDGTDDILLKNDSGTPTWHVYYMLNGDVDSDSAVSALATSYGGSGYLSRAAGDMNGDGKADLLFSSDSGSVRTWYVYSFATDTVTTPSGLNTSPYNSTVWQFQAMVDLNADGKMDVVLRNSSTGAWEGFTTGSSFASTAYSLDNLDTAPSVLLVSHGDFNGDGAGDFLFRDTSSGDYSMLLTLLPGFAPSARANSTTYALNLIIDVDGYAYLCTTEGTSDSSAPSFDTTPGNTTTDGTVVWTNIGSTSDYTAGQQVLAGHPALTTPGSAVWSVVDDAWIDRDGDGMPDNWEIEYGLNPLVDDAASDPDGDGMPNLWEYQHGLDPTNSADALDDADGDGLLNVDEYSAGTNPNVADTDGDGMPDGWEVTYGLDPLDNGDASGDADSDGMPNLWEYQNGFDPTDAADATEDADSDSLLNQSEYEWGTNPHNPDTDNDGLTDWREIVAANAAGFVAITTGPQNRMDPPLVFVDKDYIAALDDTYSNPAYANLDLWNVSDGSAVYWNAGYAKTVAGVTTTTIGSEETLCALSTDGSTCLPSTTIYGGRKQVGNLDHACILDAGDGTHASAVHCFGDANADSSGTNHYGQITVPSLTAPTDIAVGLYHSCALDGSNVVCWGKDTGSSEANEVPTFSSTPLAIAAGDAHTCAIITSSPYVQCWGDSSDGKLTPPTLDHPWQIAAGKDHTCVIDGDYTVKCWGKNDHYQSQVPTALGDASTVVARLSASGDETCASSITSDRAITSSITCWPVNVDLDGDSGTLVDSDSDGMPDGWEVQYGLNPLDDTSDNGAAGDPDSDGMPNLWEYTYGLDPTTDDAGDPAAGDSLSGCTVSWTNLQIYQHGLDPTICNFYLSAHNDYDGDKTSDVLMKDNDSDVYAGQWMQFKILNGAVSASNAFYGADIQYVASLDITGDGVADVLVRDTSTGDWYVYLVQDGQQNGVTLLSSLPTGSNWVFAAAGDFNGDGTDDILLKNDSGTPTWHVYYMLNGDVNSDSAVSTLASSYGGSGYVPQGAADMNGDGKADLLFSSDSGSARTWYVYNFDTDTVTTPSGLNTSPYNTTAWDFQALADLNADGKTDVVLRSNSTGVWKGFTMGSSFVPTAYTLNNLDTGSSISLASYGDFNGDGTGDLLLLDSTTHDYSMYLTLPPGFTAAVRANSSAYTVNQIAIPNPSDSYAYLCTTAGTSGSSAPTFDTTPGNTTADGSVVWTNIDSASYYTAGQQVLVGYPALTTPGSGVWDVLK